MPPCLQALGNPNRTGIADILVHNQLPKKIRAELTTNIDIRDHRFRPINVHHLPEASKDGCRAAVRHAHHGAGSVLDYNTDVPIDDAEPSVR